MTGRDRDIERAQRIVRRYAPVGVSLVDELIRERREEAAREAREYEDQGPLDVEAVRRRLGLLRGDDEGRG